MPGELLSKETVDFLSMVGIEVTAVGTMALAVVTVIAVRVARKALGDWRSTLKNERADECTGAARDLRNFVYRCIDMKTSGQPQGSVWKAYDEAWTSWRILDRSYVILSRYDSRLDMRIPDTLSGELFTLEALCNTTTLSAASPIATQIKTNVSDLVNSLEQAIKTEPT